MSIPGEINEPLLADFPEHSYEQWREAAEKILKGVAFDQAMHTQTPEGIDLGPIYSRQDVEGLPQVASFPGFPPFLRGRRASGYAAGGGEVAQELRVSLRWRCGVIPLQTALMGARTWSAIMCP